MNTENVISKTRVPLFGNTVEEEVENLTVLALVAVATALWFGWKLLARERSWIQVQLSHYLALIFGIQLKGGELRLGTETPAKKKAKRKVQFKQQKRPPVKQDEDASFSVDTLSLLMSRFPVVSRFFSQTEECELFLQEVEAKLEQPLVQAGLAGVQTWLSCNVKWGPFGSDRGAWCDISDNLKKLRCTAASSFAKWAMELSPEVQKKEVFVGQCQFVLKCNDPSEVTMINNFFAEDDKTPEFFLVDNMMYHECIVKITKIESRATVWDFGIEYDAPNSSKAGLAIVAFRFVGDFPQDNVHFGNYTVPTNKWFSTCPEVRHPQVVSILKPYLSQHQNKKHIDLYGLRMTNKAENHQFTVFVSGTAMNNGNPCPGVGLARCLRRSYGSRVRIVGFEYSLASGGIRDPVFDGSLIIKQFYGKKPFVKKEALGRIRRALEETPNSWYISCFDVEIDLLTQAKDEYADEDWVHRLLIPTNEVLESTEKPDIHVIQKHFGMVPPENLMIEEDNEEEVKQFFRDHGPSVLVKGVKFGCAPLACAGQAKCARASFTKGWGTDCFIQKAIHGYERSYMFSSFNGKLLGAIEMRKDIVTAEGKCWGVHLEPLTVETMENLKRMCAETKWTGGGEIEFMEDMTGKKFCTDFNPRFPAWVFGGCHGGINLPGLLMQEVTGIATDDVTSPTLGGDFIRSVLEVPVCNKMVQPVFMAGPDLSGCRGAVVTKCSFGSLNLSDNEVIHAISHPSRFGEIAQLSRIEEGEEDVESDTEEESSCCIIEEIPDEEVWVFDPTELEKTPQFMFDVQTLKNTIDSITAFTEKININTIVGLSVKTQPHSIVLKTAREAGWYSECISQAEVQKSLDMGFPSSEIIVNGPLKNWPAPLPTDGLKAWFADSLADWDELIKTTPAEYIGFRLTPHNITSRFGVPIEKWREMKKRFDAVPETQKIGLHFHFAQTKLGSKSWFAMARSVLRMIPMMTKRATLLDFGGGWVPGALVEHVDDMNELVDFARKRCPLVETVVFEPGKSVTQASGGFITQVKGFRGGCGQQRNMKKPGEYHGEGIIVDGFIGDLGVYGLHRHPCFYNSKIEVENENIVCRSAEEKDLPFLVDSVLASTKWDCEQNAESVLCKQFFHFSKWLVAELDGEVVGCVFSYNMDTVELKFEATNPLGEMVGDSILSERNGLHLMCLHATNEDAYSSMLEVLLKGSFDLKLNSVYLVQSQDSEEDFSQFGFRSLEDEETSDDEESSSSSDFKVSGRKHWTLLQPGKDKILGRICMEFDQFGHIKTPEDLKVGDHILIRECGAYDMTMSYLFGDAKERDILCL